MTEQNSTQSDLDQTFEILWPYKETQLLGAR